MPSVPKGGAVHSVSRCIFHGEKPRVQSCAPEDARQHNCGSYILLHYSKGLLWYAPPLDHLVSIATARGSSHAPDAKPLGTETSLGYLLASMVWASVLNLQSIATCLERTDRMVTKTLDWMRSHIHRSFLRVRMWTRPQGDEHSGLPVRRQGINVGIREKGVDISDILYFPSKLY